VRAFVCFQSDGVSPWALQGSTSALNPCLNHSAVLKGAGIQQHRRGTVSIRY